MLSFITTSLIIAIHLLLLTETRFPQPPLTLSPLSPPYKRLKRKPQSLNSAMAERQKQVDGFGLLRQWSIVLFVYMFHFNSVAVAILDPVDSLALQSIRKGLEDLPGSSYFASWDFTSDPCNFAGVYCDSDKVIALNLGDPRAGAPGLTGRIDPAIGRGAEARRRRERERSRSQKTAREGEGQKPETERRRQGERRWSDEDRERGRSQKTARGSRDGAHSERRMARVRSRKRKRASKEDDDDETGGP